MEEPDLAEDQRGRKQRARGRPGSSRHEQDERDQPHEVLRREEAVEDEEAGGSCREGEREPLWISSHAGIEGPHGRDGRELEHRHERRDGIRKGAREIAGHRTRRAPHDGRVVQPQPVGGQERRSAQALDLKAPRVLRMEAVPEPARRKQGERRDHERHDPAENEQRLEDTAATRNGPEVRGRRRHEHERIELRGHRQPEQAERE